MRGKFPVSVLATPIPLWGPVAAGEDRKPPASNAVPATQTLVEISRHRLKIWSDREGFHEAPRVILAPQHSSGTHRVLAIYPLSTR